MEKKKQAKQREQREYYIDRSAVQAKVVNYKYHDYSGRRAGAIWCSYGVEMCNVRAVSPVALLFFLHRQQHEARTFQPIKIHLGLLWKSLGLETSARRRNQST